MKVYIEQKKKNTKEVENKFISVEGLLIENKTLLSIIKDLELAYMEQEALYKNVNEELEELKQTVANNQVATNEAIERLLQEIYKGVL